MAVLTLGTIWFLVSLRLRHLTAQVQQRFSDRHGERLRIARELHDTLIQGFQGPIVKFQAVANTIPRESPARHAVEHLLDRADEVIVEGRYCVRDLRSVDIGGGSLESQIENVVETFRDECGGALKFEVAGDPWPVRIDVADGAVAICRETLTNSVRHAEAAVIECNVALFATGVPLALPR